MDSHLLFTLYVIVFSINYQATGEITLRLNGIAYYGRPFSLICFNSLKNETQYAIFFRSLSLETTGSRVAVVLYINSTCSSTPSSFRNYTYSCQSNGTEIALIVPGENEVEHNTYWRCTNPGGVNENNNNVVKAFVNVRITSVNLTRNGLTINDTVLTVDSGEAVTLTCVASVSRPEASFLWYMGSELIGAGQQLTFTPEPENHGQKLHCLAYNTDLDTAVSSQSPVLRIRGIPNKPTHLSVLYRTVDTIVLSWMPGYSDGQTQTFVLEGKLGASHNWTNMSYIAEIDARYAAVIQNLAHSGTYLFRMFAFTSVGRGNYSDLLNVTLLENNEQANASDTRAVIHATTEVGPIVGTGIGGVVFGAAATVLILVFRRKFATRKRNSLSSGPTKTEDTYYNIAVTELDAEERETAPPVSTVSKSLQDQDNYSQLMRSVKNENEYDKVQHNT